MWPCACTERENVHHTFVLFLLHFFIGYLKFWNLSLLKMKKIDATLEKDIDQMQLFCFINFFQFSKEVLQNGSFPFACLLACPSRFFIGSWLSQMTSDLHKTFTKWKLLSPKQIKYALSIAHARVHAQRVKTWTKLFCLFCYFLGSDF